MDMEHSELITEMSHIEKLTTQERLRLAHKRRIQQMKRWSQREKEWNNKRNKMIQNEQKKRRNEGFRVHFVNSVMLLEAAGRNDIDEVRRLLTDGVSPDSTNEDGLTALHQCCIDDNQKMMILLLEYGANVNAEDSEKWTPLHAAATCGHLHLVKYLITNGANLLAVNADGNMPYDICEDDSTLDYIELEMAKRGVTQDLIEETRSAVETRMLVDLKYIAERGEDLEAKDHMGATPLHIASANGYMQVVEFLLDNHVSTDCRDNDDWQPIHAAACWGHPDVLELLVQNGADLDAQTRNHETPQDICEDPELRERIIQLRCEQESKRIQDAQRKKIRRSQSSNTRTQSIRRTSYREKNLTSKKEAVEEAKIRIQMENGTEGHDIPDNRDLEERPSKETEDEEVDLAMLLLLKRDTHGEIRLSANERNKLLKLETESDREGEKEISEFIGETVLEAIKVEEIPMTNNNHKNGKAHAEINENIITDGMHPSMGDTGSKIDIHVSVTINTNSGTYTPSPGTLADLKKQRSLSRSSMIVPNNHNFSTSENETSYEPPPSPTISLRRFAGLPSEVIGTPEKQGCCILM